MTRTGSTIRPLALRLATWLALVVLAATSLAQPNLLTNGDFTLPFGALPCDDDDASPNLAGVPLGWVSTNPDWTWRYSHVYDQCPGGPLGDGFYCGLRQAGEIEGTISQVVQTGIVAGNAYRLAGYWAAHSTAEGPNARFMDVKVELLNEDGSLIGRQATTVGGSPTGFDMAPFVPIVGVASGGQVTVAFTADSLGGWSDAQAFYFDDLELTEEGPCTTPISLSGVTPDHAANDGPVTLTVTGSGFNAGLPTLQMTDLAATLTATGVNVTSDTSLTCDFDLTGVTPGRYALRIQQGGCLDLLPSGVLVAAVTFANGDFEDPPGGQGECEGVRLIGLPAGWSSDAPSGLFRDAVAPPPSMCPSPAGGHYASMSEDTAETVRAWQTLAVTPGWTYRLTGQFDAPAGVAVRLRLLDGDIDDPSLAEAVVDTGPAAWVPGEVEATAASNVMTAAWEMDISGVSPDVGGHADGFVFETIAQCNAPFADADGDTDVDATDFATFQRCYTDSVDPVALPAQCRCFDRDFDADVDHDDREAFQLCSSGPDVPANPDCD